VIVFHSSSTGGALLAAATPTFNAGAFHTAIVYIAAAVIAAIGIVILAKYAKRGEVGEATNSLFVVLIGSFLVVGASTMLVFGQLIADATIK
jgi:hypothetical protein